MSNHTFLFVQQIKDRIMEEQKTLSLVKFELFFIKNSKHNALINMLIHNYK